MSYDALNKNTCVRVVNNINDKQIFYNCYFVVWTLKKRLTKYSICLNNVISKMYKTNQVYLLPFNLRVTSLFNYYNLYYCQYN